MIPRFSDFRKLFVRLGRPLGEPGHARRERRAHRNDEPGSLMRRGLIARVIEAELLKFETMEVRDKTNDRLAEAVARARKAAVHLRGRTRTLSTRAVSQYSVMRTAFPSRISNIQQ